MSGTHRSGAHGKPRTARDGEPGLITRTARSLFSPVKAYGVITLVFLHLAGIVVNIGLAAVVVEQQARAVEQRPAAEVVTVPGPTITARPDDSARERARR